MELRADQNPASEKARRTHVGKFSRIIAIIVLFALGLFVGRYIVPAGELKQTPLQFVAVENGERRFVFPTFWEAWDILHKNFIGELHDSDLFYGAVEGMIRAAGDPYTVFSSPLETQQFEETIEGSFSGVGVEIGMRRGLITVIAPLDGSPAQKAGVQAEDVIVAVDHKPITSEDTLDNIVRKIRGPEGQTVTLTVVHKGEQNTQDIAIVRGTIAIESVRLEIDNNHIAHLEVSNFNGDTADRFANAAREMRKANVSGVILDLRGNPGGFLQSSVKIASQFLKPDSVVVIERGSETKEYLSKGKPTLEGLPVVVLVDEGSASASEILAGALRDQINSPLIGTKTFGKGSVQEFVKLSDGSSLRITVAKWFTPRGDSIDEKGIVPAIEVDDKKDTDADEPLDRAREELERLIQATS